MIAVAAIVTVAFMGSVVISPLYVLFQQKFGFSTITLTLVYATYVVGNVVALLLFGQISDQAGRKRTALLGLGLAGVSAVVFMSASSTVWLFAGRALIGLAVGIASGTGTAWLAERYGPNDRRRATLVATTANLTGIAIGPLMGGLLAAYAPDPLRLPFIAYICLLVIVATAVALTPESRTGRVENLREIRVCPRLGVPRESLVAFAPPAVTAFVCFALGGLYFALIPSIILHDLHDRNVAVGGIVIFELGAVAVAVNILGRRLRPAVAMTAGLVVILPAVALVVITQADHSMPLLLVASALAGMATALGYRGSLEVVNEIAPDDRRAEIVSTYYIACFVGNSIPVIGIGVLSTLIGVLTASIVFACTIAVFSIAALSWRQRTRFQADHAGKWPSMGGSNSVLDDEVTRRRAGEVADQQAIYSTSRSRA